MKIKIILLSIIFTPIILLSQNKKPIKLGVGIVVDQNICDLAGINYTSNSNGIPIYESIN